MQRTTRDSNLELLRIIAMLMIIALHQNGTSNALSALSADSGNYYVTNAIEAISICSVNCFVLLSGYFMVRKDTAPVKKCLRLILDVAFWGCFGLLLNYVVFGKSPAIKELIVAIVPYIKGNRWFVRDYIILTLLSPFINQCLVRLSKRNYQILIALLIAIFSLWPSFFPNPPIDDHGYSCVHFVQMYIIAGYLKLHWNTHVKTSVSLLCFVGATGITFLSAIHGLGYAYAYNYTFTILSSVCLFMAFKGVQMQSRVINILASNTFDVFLIHTTAFFADLVYVRVFHVDTALYGSTIPYLLGLLVCPPIFYLSSSVLAVAKNWIFNKTIYPIVDKLPLKDYKI